MENKNTSKEVLITYLFDAPRELVFKAWTDPELLKKWYAPNGCTIAFTHIDIREGGTFASCIKTPAYHDCRTKGEYKEIVYPEKIVYSMTSTDEHGNEAEPEALGMHPEWPKTTLVSVTFEDIEGKTKLTLRQTASEDLAKETGAHPGWLQMLDRLAEGLNY